jgi:beta-lactamase regulating signal transducer with metallopeptidase domain
MLTILDAALANAVLATGLAVAAAAVARFLRRPAFVHLLWTLVLLRLLMPPAVRVPVPGWLTEAPAEDATVCDTADLDPESGPRADGPRAESAGGSSVLRWSWTGVGLAVWAGGAIFWFGRTGLRVRRFARLLRFARPAPAETQRRAAEIAQRLGLRRCPGVWLVGGAVSPMVWAAGGRPRLLLPERLLADLPAERTDALLAHELAHVRRGDHWVRYLELAVSGLFWWHPVVWWARRRLHEAEEQCCDALAVRALGDDGRSYALALLDVVAFVSGTEPAPAVACGVGPVPQLRRRLTMVMQGKAAPTPTRAGLLAVLGCAVPVLLFGPVRAEPPAKPAEKPKPAKADVKGVVLSDSDVLGLQVIDADTADIAELIIEQQPSEEVKKLRAEVEDLTKKLAAKRKELKDLEVKQGGGKGKLIVTTPTMVRSRLVNVREPVNLGHIVIDTSASMKNRSAELEKKLDRLIKEVEELRKEIRKPE